MNVWPHTILCIAAVVNGITIDNKTRRIIPVGSDLQLKVIDMIAEFVYEKEPLIFAAYSFRQEWEGWLKFELAHFIRITRINPPSLVRMVRVDVDYPVTPGLNGPPETVDIEVIDETTGQRLAIELEAEIGVAGILNELRKTEQKLRRFEATYRLVVGATGSLAARNAIIRTQKYSEYRGLTGLARMWIEGLN